MRSIGSIVVLCLAMGIGGCANHPFNAVNSTSYRDQANSHSRVFAWDSKYSAGIGNSRGMCVQGALTAKSTAFTSALEIAAEKLDVEARGGVSFAEAVMALNASSVQTAYANLGYFYLCQIALNQSNQPGSLNAEQIESMWKHVGDTAKALNLAAVDLNTLNAPELADLRIYLEKLGVEDIPESEEELQGAIKEAVSEKEDGGGA